MPSDPKPCKCCGTCPTCGRRPQPVGVYPWPTYPWPHYPTTPYPYGTYPYYPNVWVSTSANVGIAPISTYTVTS